MFFSKNWILLWGLCIMLNAEVSREPLDDPGPGESDPAGWVTIFDGTQVSLESYWWISDASHGDGGRWWVAPDPSVGKDVLWSDQNPGGKGGLLYTHRRYKNLEAEVMIKPTFGNDGGIFFRSNGKGSAWQVVIDYLKGNRVGGVYAEKLDYPVREKLYELVSPTTITYSGWEEKTPWTTIWNAEGYNRIKGSVTGRPVRLLCFINEKYQTLDYQAPKNAEKLDKDGMGYLGLQIHGGTGAWKGPNKYQWVKVREVDRKLNPIIIPKAPSIITQPKAQKVSLGAQAVFTVTAKYGSLLKYQWMKNGTAIPGAVKDTLKIPSVKTGDAGSYTVVLSNQVGPNTAASQPAALTIIGVSIHLNRIQFGSSYLKWESRSGNAVHITGRIGQPYEISLTDMRGRVVWREVSDGEHVSHHIPYIQEGLGFLKIKTGGKIRLKKIMHLK